MARGPASRCALKFEKAKHRGGGRGGWEQSKEGESLNEGSPVPTFRYATEGTLDAKIRRRRGVFLIYSSLYHAILYVSSKCKSQAICILFIAFSLHRRDALSYRKATD